ncbi:MAG: hypothetical protein M0D57_17845 [Sphingobacteriales bacterium JAD_PAG50586_3]|nr:MAG: hypothetical protein M0D57_17845 [Sphingobacteriales bacterium JAD_PAG50586_3]
METNSTHRVKAARPVLLLVVCYYIIFKAVLKTVTAFIFLVDSKLAQKLGTSDGFDIILKGGTGLQLSIIALSGVAVYAALQLLNFKKAGFTIYTVVIIASYLAPIFFGVENYRPTMTEFTLSVAPMLLLYRYRSRMDGKGLIISNFYSDTLAKEENWFWDWVDYHHKNPAKLEEWYQTATKEELTIFYNKYESVAQRLIPNYEGIYVTSTNTYLTEDVMEGLNNWIIGQGPELWAMAAKKAEARSQYTNPADNPEEKIWETLYTIYSKSKAQKLQNGPQPITSWQGVSWQTRYQYFPGANANTVFEERFGASINEFI